MALVAAVEQVQSLARELVHAMDVAKKKKQKKQKHFAKLKSDHTIQFITIKSY